jgi:Tfp pilus assembly protein PilV
VLSNLPTRGQSLRPRQHRWHRRGTSLIEVVCAAFILSIAVTMIFTAVSAVTTAELRARRQLEALELANRLILQYLDDKESMPNPAAHIELSMGPYRWTLVESPIDISLPEKSVFELNQSQSAKVMDQTKLLSITVYAGLPDGLGGYAQGEQLATLARIHNPLTILSRNPDAMLRITANPQALMEFVLRLVEQQDRGTTQPAPNAAGRPNASPSAPAPNTRPNRREDTPFGGAGDR